jgi:flavin reductase (DIM6/NTAB) family NADH-FMN oxidoreductase RutF
VKEFLMAELEPRDRYQLLTRSVGPRPIAFVSSLSKDGIGNLAPFSYFNVGGANPPSAIICPVKDRNANTKDTLNNIRDTGEYVINICTRSFAEKMSQTSFAYGPEIDEFDAAGLTRVPSVHVKPPRVGESPIHLEMKLFQLVEHGQGPLSSDYIIGEILSIHCDETVLTDGLPDNTKINHIGRLGESWYSSVDEQSLFELERPTKP